MVVSRADGVAVSSPSIPAKSATRKCSLFVTQQRFGQRPLLRSGHCRPFPHLPQSPRLLFADRQRTLQESVVGK